MQDEIDRVVGTDRLPEFEDREYLPYTECVIKEVYRSVFFFLYVLNYPHMYFRWHPAAPLGLSTRHYH